VFVIDLFATCDDEQDFPKKKIILKSWGLHMNSFTTTSMWKKKEP
jgi:hypothetical protein